MKTNFCTVGYVDFNTEIQCYWTAVLYIRSVFNSVSLSFTKRIRDETITRAQI
jgi:hypothetical protein